MPDHTHSLGDWTITRIDEIALSLPPAVLLPDWDSAALTPEAMASVAPTFAANGTDLRVPVHSWLLRRGDLTVLVDTGVGNGRTRAFAGFNNLDTDYLSRLDRAGVRPEAVDFVLCTHIHTDHVGWNTRRDGDRWVPTFPNARYLWGQVEGAVVRRPFFQEGLAANVYQDSILPVLDAGLADEVPLGAFAAIPGLTFHSTPGHSPGHLSLTLETGEGLAMFGGDVLHNQAQVYRPDWNSVFCEAPDAARRSRFWALETCAEHDALFFGTHLGGSAVGRIARDGERFSWTYA